MRDRSEPRPEAHGAGWTATWACALGVALGCAACGDGLYGNGTTDPPDSPGPGPDSLLLALETVADGLSDAVYLTHAPFDSSRLFIVQQGGVVRVLQDDTLLTDPFLDISGSVRSGGEQGLLSLAFDPDYAQSGEFYLDYTDTNGDTRVERRRVSDADPNVADPAFAELVLLVDQPDQYTNHNGGLVKFGPDGMLYVGLGDGGGGGDPLENGQDSTTLLGSLLRIKVDGETTYAIPSDNPLVNDSAAAPEIWDYGLRNPWRFSFDRATGDLYIADVGQNAWEEVNFEPPGIGGLNYGWNIMEGKHCFQATTCDQSGLTLPVLEYANDANTCSVTGGYVYRGARIPDLQGHYFYADFCSGFVRSFRYEGGQVTEETDWTSQLSTGGQVSSFGEDAAGELYIVTLSGSVYRIVPGS